MAKLAALEKTAMTNEAGAWATSRPETRDPSVQEPPDPMGRPRWLDSLLSAAAGAAIVATAWMFTMAKRWRVQANNFFAFLAHARANRHGKPLSPSFSNKTVAYKGFDHKPTKCY